MHLTFPIRSDRLAMQVRIREIVARETSAFQQIEIVQTEVFGRVLLLDGHIQLTTFDEFAYHEGLVQIPAVNLGNPASALVIGGGDGGVLRELCKHHTLDRIDMVEIDADVIHLCREHLPEVSGGAFEDPRVNLQIGDAFAFVRDAEGPYDLIVADSTDVYEEDDGHGLSEALFTADFYRDCRRLLSPRGTLVTQADNLVFCPYSLEAIRKVFAEVFPRVGSYHALVPSFGGFSGYCWGSAQAAMAETMPSVEVPLRYLNPTTYALAFAKLPF